MDMGAFVLVRIDVEASAPESIEVVVADVHPAGFAGRDSMDRALLVDHVRATLDAVVFELALRGKDTLAAEHDHLAVEVEAGCKV
jgi:hypothetical protein